MAWSLYPHTAAQHHAPNLVSTPVDYCHRNVVATAFRLPYGPNVPGYLKATWLVEEPQAQTEFDFKLVAKLVVAGRRNGRCVGAVLFQLQAEVFGHSCHRADVLC